MSDTVKKKWSKKKKILVIVFSIIFSLLVLAVIGGVIGLNMYCKAPEYTVTQISDSYKDKVQLIAHRGFRAVAPENTIPAYEEAGKASFWGAENDVYRTSDGIWVIHHDPVTYRMMDKNVFVEKHTYKELLELNNDNGSNIENYPDLKIATLEDYLKVCKQYNMVAVIELKSKNDTEHYDEIVEMVDKYGVEVNYISFKANDLIEMRKLTDAPMYYLTQKITDKKVETAKSIENCGVSFNANKKKNQEKENFDLITDAGLEPAIWTVDDETVLEMYSDWGVKYVTTNQICY